MYLRMKEVPKMEAQEKPRVERTPWTPSRLAIQRVVHPLPIPTKCRHCGSAVEIAHNSEIYPTAFGEWPWLYLCRGCGAYVGMHPYTNLPLGTLANRAQREARKEVKQLFNSLWLDAPDRRAARSQAYAWLASKMGLTEAQCHFGQFDELQCDAAMKILESAYADLRRQIQRGGEILPQWKQPIMKEKV